MIDLAPAEQEAMREGWEIITPFHKHRCNVCVAERTEQERVAPLMARDVILGPFPENGGIDPAYGVVPSLIEAS